MVELVFTEEKRVFVQKQRGGDAAAAKREINALELASSCGRWFGGVIMMHRKSKVTVGIDR